MDDFGNEVMIDLVTFIHTRSINYNQQYDFFYIDQKNGTYLKIDSKNIFALMQKYLVVMNNCFDKDDNNKISMLYSADQPIFSRRIWDSIAYDLSKTYNDMVNLYKLKIKQQCEEEPEIVIDKVKQILSNVSESENSNSDEDIEVIKNKVMEYLLQLLDEGVLTEEILAETDLFQSLDVNFVRKLYNEGKISIETLRKTGLVSILSTRRITDLYQVGKLDSEDVKKVFGNDGIKKLYLKAFRRKGSKNRADANLYRELLDVQAALDLYIHGSLDKEFILGFVDCEKLIESHGLTPKIREAVKDLHIEYLKRTLEQYTSSDILRMVSEHSLDSKALDIVPIDQLIESTALEEIKVEDVFGVYKRGIITAQQLSKVCDEYELVNEKRAGIVNLIDDSLGDNDGNRFSIIKELYENNVLSHSDILDIRDKGLLTQEQYEELSDIDIKREYDNLFNNTSWESEASSAECVDNAGKKIGVGTSSRSIPLTRASIREKMKFFDTIGENDIRELIGREEDGKRVSFDGYSIIGFRELGIVILENFEKSRNATYMMTLQELKSHVEKDDDGTIVFKPSKAMLMGEIADGKAVRKKIHHGNWNRNVVSSIIDLLEQTNSRVSDENLHHLSTLTDRFDKEGLSLLQQVRATKELAARKLSEAKKLEAEVQTAVANNEKNNDEEVLGE